MDAEVGRKIEHAARIARTRGLAGIVLATRHNFAWLTAGIESTIDASRETSAGALLVTAAGRPFILANNIEAPRLADRVQPALGAAIVEFPWTAERADPSLPFARAADAAGGPVGADVATPHATPVEGDLARVRVTLDEAEIPRYRALAADAARALEGALRQTRPGTSEIDVRRNVAAALLEARIEPVVLLAGGDDRIRRFRHPIASLAAWHRQLLVALCGARQGQVVALSRILSVARSDDFIRRTRAAANVFATLLDATVPSATGASIFAAAALAYAREGFPGEERLHHQGGAIAYRSREWVAHPASGEVVGGGQAFAWNPSITGTKVEDTCFLRADGRVEVLTQTGSWPTIPVQVRGATLQAPDALVTG